MREGVGQGGRRAGELFVRERVHFGEGFGDVIVRNDARGDLLQQPQGRLEREAGDHGQFLRAGHVVYLHERVRKPRHVHDIEVARVLRLPGGERRVEDARERDHLRFRLLQQESAVFQGRVRVELVELLGFGRLRLAGFLVEERQARDVEKEGPFARAFVRQELHVAAGGDVARDALVLLRFHDGDFAPETEFADE